MRNAIKLIRWRTSEHGVWLGVTVDRNQAVLVDAVLPTVITVDGGKRYCRELGIGAAEWADHVLDGAIAPVDIAADPRIAPLELSELWAAGVTHELGRDAREAETTSAPNFYRKVYGSNRPEVFFKAPGPLSVFAGTRHGMCLNPRSR